MKNKIRFKHTCIALTAFVLSFVLFSCKDNSVTTTNNQNTGPQPTPVGTPNGIPVTATIGASGGSMISADSTLELIIPAGALGTNTDITIQPITNFCYNSAGNAFRLTPDGLQFQQPVTIKFHYADTTLAGTLGDFMGIAYQDAAGYWYYMDDLTNDTVSRVISAPITHFTDWSFFDIAHLEPRQANVRVHYSLNIRLTYAAPSGNHRIGRNTATIGSWLVQPSSVGGTIIGHADQSATFTAPLQVPQQNPVTVSANVNTHVNYRGHVTEVYQLNSWIRIMPALSDTFDLHIEMAYDLFGMVEYHCDYTDVADMVVTQHNTSVSIRNISNRMPDVNPPSGHYPNGQGLITWIPGNDSGLINIRGGFGAIIHDTLGINPDTIGIAFFHSGTRAPLFHCVPPSGEPYYVGGEEFPGVPEGLFFRASDSTQTVFIPEEHITATLTPRH